MVFGSQPAIPRFRMSDFEITITQDKNEILEAQRLRFEVFNLEMGKGLASSYEKGLDSDEYDSFCDHLIVRDSHSKRVIGTYRLLLGAKAPRRVGFYSEGEFDLEKIKRLKGEVLELGRSCTHKDYRDKALIPLMWEAIARYVKTHRVKYLFGCASLYTTDPFEVSEAFGLLKAKYYAPEEFRVHPLPGKSFSGLDEGARIEDEHALFSHLPNLFKGYLRIGALVCGLPALDAEFGTADFFLLLDINHLGGDYLRRFGPVGSKVLNAVG
jgi:putative hemolysin